MTAGSGVRQAVKRHIGHAVFGSRPWIRRQLNDAANRIGEGRVLEIGSGRTDLGDQAYSMRTEFPRASEFVQSDLNPAFGHQVIDVTTMDLEREFDGILCISVLEHIPRFWEAIPRLHRALTPGGWLVLSVPMAFPYHDTPSDYWRFTRYGVESMLENFAEVDIRTRGFREMPFSVFALARR